MNNRADPTDSLRVTTDSPVLPEKAVLETETAQAGTFLDNLDLSWTQNILSEETKKELKCFFDPFENHFVYNREYKGKQMDYFGYLAHRITEWKEEKIFPYSLELRAPAVLVSTMLTFRCKFGLISYKGN